MSANQKIILAIFIVYLALNAAIGIIFSNRQNKKQHTSSEKKFFIGGRNMNGLLLAMTTMATYTSVSSFISGPGAAGLTYGYFYRFCMPPPKAGKAAVVRYFFISQQPHKVYSVPASFFQVSVTVDTALVSIAYYFEHHLCIGCRFSTFGRIRFVQFPVVQFLKLCAGQPYRCCLW